jgi:hypothetical protein
MSQIAVEDKTPPKVTRVLSFDIGTVNMAYALVKYEHSVDNGTVPDAVNNPTSWKNFHILQWECVNIFEACGSVVKNSKTVPIERCVRYISEVLMQRENLLQDPVDYILIERQVRKAPRNLMASVAVLAFYRNYWLLGGKFSTTYLEPKIILIPSTGKLHIGTYADVFTFDANHPAPIHHVNDATLSAGQNKTRRKKKAVELCETFVLQQGHLQSWLTVFRKHKKRDDLSDCLLQAVHYLQKNAVSATGKSKKKRKFDQVATSNTNKRSTKNVSPQLTPTTEIVE